MRIGLLHNRYVYRGGEDSVFAAEAQLLREAGHTVVEYVVDNRDAIGPGIGNRLKVGLRSAWNPQQQDAVAAFARRERIDVGHLHNFFPLLSPAAYAGLRDAGVPVVQTLHNYRLFCGNGVFVRNGSICEECTTRGPWHAVRYGCYRGSRLQTAAWARMVSVNRRRRTWQTLVDHFLVPSEFSREVCLRGGLPAERITVKPNPVPDPGNPQFGGQGVIYVGRLSPEKGVDILLDAWRGMRGQRLTIVGTGPLDDVLRQQAEGLEGVTFTGEMQREDALDLIRGAALLVSPSRCYETFGMTGAEAMALGKPVIAPQPSAIAELVIPNETGLHFESGNAEDLRSCLQTLLNAPEQCEAFGRTARERYETELTPTRVLDILHQTYGAVGAGEKVNR